MLNDKAKLFITATSLLNPGWARLIAITHAWHETAGFAKVVGQHNYWGIKVPQKRPWTGMTATVTTTEFMRILTGEALAAATLRAERIFGRAPVRIERGPQMWRVVLPLQFVDFTTVGEALAYYDNLIMRLYPDSYAARGSAVDFFSSIVDPKKNRGNQYATDPRYTQSALAVYRMLALDPDVKAAFSA